MEWKGIDDTATILEKVSDSKRNIREGMIMRNDSEDKFLELSSWFKMEVKVRKPVPRVDMLFT